MAIFFFLLTASIHAFLFLFGCKMLFDFYHYRVPGRVENLYRFAIGMILIILGLFPILVGY